MPDPGRQVRGDDPRQEVLARAAELLATEGPAALSVRRIAAEAGESTQVIYTRFGGKAGVIEGLYHEGFRRLAAALEAVPHSGDPLTDLVAVQRAYRRAALQNPAFYAVMFGRPIPEFEPSIESRRLVWGTFGSLVEAVRSCVEAGEMVAPRGDEDLARELWGAAHGLVSLELAQMVVDDPCAEERFDDVIAALIAFHRPRRPPG